MWVAVEEAGGKLIRNEIDDDGMDARVKCSEVIAMGESCGKSGGKGKEERFVNGVATLAMSLTLQLLNVGEDESDDSPKIPEGMNLDDEDEVDHEVTQSVFDLVSGMKRFMGVDDDENDDDDYDDVEPLAEISDVCVSVMAMNTGGDNGGRGSSIKGIRAATMNCWKGAINMVGDFEGALVEGGGVSEQVLMVLLESIADEEFVGEGEGDDNDVEDDDEEEEEEEEEIDPESFNDIADDSSDSDSDGDGNSNNDKPQQQQEEEEELMLDPDELEKMLLDDNDSDGSEEPLQLEHHSGADAALAALIKMKTATRKKAVLDRKRTLLAHRLRCFALLEALFKKNLVGAGVMKIIIPLLKTRRRLEKEIGGNGGGKNAATKQELSNKIEKLVKERVSKVRERRGRSEVTEARNIDSLR